MTKSKKKALHAHELVLPPMVPETLAELDRAVMLLGALAKGDGLKKSRKDELKALLGAIPKAETAARWKSELKRVRDEYA